MINILKLVCPKDHCIMAAGYNTDNKTKAELIDFIEQTKKKHGFVPYCGICMTTKLHYEEIVTTFNTMPEAQPLIEKLAIDNADAMNIAGIPPEQSRLN